MLYKYLPKEWKGQIATSLTVLLMLMAGPLLFSVALVLITRLAPVLLPLLILTVVVRLLARWR
jgi:hypothetical protein